jgi:hypothetical protein
MGTDIYLEWDNMTEKEKEAACPGWAIDAGNAGYLRASIHMDAENTVLCIVFPDRYWKAGEPIEYDFVENTKRLPDIIAGYLRGEKMKEGNGIVEKQKMMRDTVLQLLEAKGVEKIQFGENTGSEAKKIWAHSLVDFFRLGAEKQKEGKHPTVYISW